MSFPPLTWAVCECGCGYEGEDDVTQFCIEEAANLALDVQMNAAADEEAEGARAAAPVVEERPGTIRDPVMHEAMEQAKKMHFERYGVRT